MIGPTSFAVGAGFAALLSPAGRAAVRVAVERERAWMELEATTGGISDGLRDEVGRRTVRFAAHQVADPSGPSIDPEVAALTSVRMDVAAGRLR